MVFTKKYIRVYFYQEGIHYCTAHKYSTETVIDASRFINRFDQCYVYTVQSHKIRFEIDCQKEQTYCLRLHFRDFSLANLFMVVVVGSM